jgi:biopolymer transport protein ExbD
MVQYHEPVHGDERAEEEHLLAEIAERRKRRTQPGRISLNMTPMIDIVFQLIIFFMIVSEFQNMEMEQITLPFALSAKEIPEASDRMVINVSSHGETTVMRSPVTPAQLARLLAHRASVSTPQGGLPNLAVKIRADADCQYQYVQEIMVQCMRSKIRRVSFGASHATGEEALEF